MPTYGFKCKDCGCAFDRFLPINECDKTQKCEDCSSESVERLFSPNKENNVIYKGSGWTVKNQRMGQDMTRKMKDTAKKQKDYYGESKLV